MPGRRAPVIRPPDPSPAAPAPPPGWAQLPFFRRDWPGIAGRLAAEAAAGRRWFPGPERLFAALALTPPERVRVVILGQDPYPSGERATGLAFGYPPGLRPTHSLRNILRELAEDTGVPRADGDLSGWARQGVLLLNVHLSVPEGQAGGHARLGWDRLAVEVLAEAARRPTAFLLWGAPAQAIAARALQGAQAGHLVLRAPHPSPLSAHRGFFGSRPFSQVNAWLASRGEPAIDW